MYKMYANVSVIAAGFIKSLCLESSVLSNKLSFSITGINRNVFFVMGYKLFLVTKVSR